MPIGRQNRMFSSIVDISLLVIADKSLTEISHTFSENKFVCWQEKTLMKIIAR